MLRLARRRLTDNVAIRLLPNRLAFEAPVILIVALIISIWRALAPCRLLGWPPSRFRLSCEQAPGYFQNFSRPKIKIPPAGCSWRWDSRIARYDSRVLASRRQKTHTYSRYNRGRPAWSSGRGKSWNIRYRKGFPKSIASCFGSCLAFARSRKSVQY
jgi:hypothetical protein